MAYYIKDSEDYWDRYPDRFAGMRVVNAQVSPSTMHVLGDLDVDTTPVALIFTMPADFELVRHSHDCERFEIILEGSLYSKEADLWLHVGDIMRVQPGEMYGPHIAGAEGCRTLEVFSTVTGATWADVELPNGEIVRVNMAKPSDLTDAGLYTDTIAH